MSDQPKHRAPERLRNRRIAGAVSVLTLVVVAGASTAGLGESASVSSQATPERGTEVTPLPVTIPEEQAEVDVEEAVKIAEENADEPLPDLSAMSLPELQDYAATMQTEFVQASLAFTEAQTQAAQSQAAAEQAEMAFVEAEGQEEVAREHFREFVVDTYESGALGEPILRMLSDGPENPADFLEELSASQMVTDLQGESVEDLTEASEHADALSEEAEDLRAAAEEAENDAETLLDDIQGRASKVAVAANEALLGSADGRTLFASAEQDARNKAALKDWRAYLGLLKRAKIVPPTADSLNNPAKLPFGLKPLVSAKGKPLVGVAAKKYKGRTVTVLSRETIASVSRSFAAVGKPYVDGNAGPETYDCSGLVSAAWASSPFRLTATSPISQYKSSGLVPVENAQVGDLVFFKAKNDGIQTVGINLGGRFMLTSDATAQQVGVQVFPGDPYAVGRPTIPRTKRNVGPATVSDSMLACGGSDVITSSSGMAYPLREGTYTFSSEFGDSGPMWSSGYHTGLDFSATSGVPVMAARGGTVTVAPSSWGGPNFVTIDHGDGLQSAYAHMSQAVVKTGDVVSTGDLVGAVGSLGNSTGSHLHFEVLVGGVKVDPMLFLASGSSGLPGWGGFANGMIPATSMCALSAPGHQLRCDAAAAWNAMAAAFQKANKVPLCITDSYRSYTAQVTLYGTKPSLAAVPGTSNHGWALAVDLCGGIESWGTPAHAWMDANAAKFGWVSPGWAQQGGGREEPWHWEFGDIS